MYLLTLVPPMSMPSLSSFVMNTRCSPDGILPATLTDQIAHFARDDGTTGAASGSRSVERWHDARPRSFRTWGITRVFRISPLLENKEGTTGEMILASPVVFTSIRTIQHCRVHRHCCRHRQPEHGRCEAGLQYGQRAQLSCWPLPSMRRLWD